MLELHEVMELTASQAQIKLKALVTPRATTGDVVRLWDDGSISMHNTARKGELISPSAGIRLGSKISDTIRENLQTEVFTITGSRKYTVMQSSYAIDARTIIVHLLITASHLN